MPVIAVAGASGAIGTLIVRAAEEGGHEVVALDRAHGCDLLEGRGLVEKLRGADAVIDASQVAAPDHDEPTGPILEAARNLARAAEEAGVGRLVMLSINGVQDEGLRAFPFYAARFAQEQAVADASIPHTVVRSAQWFEFALNPAAATEHPDAVEVQDWAIQPLAAKTVGEFLVAAALGEHGDGVVTIAGRERFRLPELTARVLAHRGDERPVRTVDAPLPGLADGSLYAPEDALLLGPSLQEWLAEDEA